MTDTMKDLLFRRIPGSQLFRVAALCALVLLLLIPLGMVEGLVHERQDRNKQVAREIQGRWGGPQVLVGPVLQVPYDLPPDESRVPVPSSSANRPPAGVAFFLPSQVLVDAALDPELRHREIYETVVYRAQLRVKGEFKPDFKRLGLAHVNPRWDEASLSLALSNPRSLTAPIELSWGDESHGFSAEGATLSRGLSPLRASGLHLQEGAAQPFAFNIDFQGSESFFLQPLGERTEVNVHAAWQHPSFAGSVLPSQHAINDEGFAARWSTSATSLGLPSAWKEERARSHRSVLQQLDGSTFGVILLQPIDSYRQVSRALKYGVLFIGLTFMAFFLFELLGKRRVHPIQYLLVGLAMSLFYLLLLSLSEHLGFDLAYGVAAAATVSLITLYCWSVLHTASGARTMLSVLACLYGYLWVVLQQQSFALLTGSLGLFAVLGIVMYLTRNVDWYGEGGRDQAESR